MTTEITNERLAELIAEEEKAMKYWEDEDQTYSFLSARDRVAAFRELASRRALDEWRPIESAPKDGTLVIVHGGVAYWRERLNHWETEGWYTITGFDYPGKPIQWNVTHWKPLPAPPAQEKTDGEAASKGSAAMEGERNE